MSRMIDLADAIDLWLPKDRMRPDEWHRLSVNLKVTASGTTIMDFPTLVPSPTPEPPHE